MVERPKRIEDDPKVKELIKVNIGRNKWRWLEKQGVQLRQDEQKQWHDCARYSIWTKDAEYIGLLNLCKRQQDTINFIYKHRLTQLSSLAMATTGKIKDYGCNSVSLGFSEQEQTWYGWTHRGYGKFCVGYEIKEGSIMDCGNHKYPFKVETLEQAKQLAIDIADYLD